MSRTRVSNVCFTVSTVKMFLEIMQFLCEYGLWDDTLDYLKRNGKTDMFVDFEVLFFFREMLEQSGQFEPSHPILKALRDHEDPSFSRFMKSEQ